MEELDEIVERFEKAVEDLKLSQKKTLTERVQEELIKRLTDAEWHKITINMKKSGHDLTISPCAQTTDINKLEDVEYFLVESPELPWLGGNTIEVISEQIANYDKHLAEQETLFFIQKLRLDIEQGRYDTEDKKWSELNWRER